MERQAACAICGGPACRAEAGDGETALCRFHVPEYEAILDAQELAADRPEARPGSV